ncbi:MAG: hypothetical protein LBR08_00285 [Bacteroidales bacterium]|jgi:hypothetical protein|nr:hypothetical protein [Bacteroidales bacterium]
MKNGKEVFRKPAGPTLGKEYREIAKLVKTVYNIPDIDAVYIRDDIPPSFAVTLSDDGQSYGVEVKSIRSRCFSYRINISRIYWR